MEVLIPRVLEEALTLKATHPEAVPIAGGTDLMVDLNFDRSRPELMIDVSRLSEEQLPVLPAPGVQLGQAGGVDHQLGAGAVEVQDHHELGPSGARHGPQMGRPY